MPQQPTTDTARKPIHPDAYTSEYYLTSVEGHAEFEASSGRHLSPRLIHALELARIRPGVRVLDVGCGRGEVVLQSALHQAHAFGIDYAQAAMQIARRALRANDQPAGLARMDATKLAFAPDTFDIAFMLDFAEHVHQPDLEQTFAELARVLKPGGRLIVHTSPNRTFEEIVYPHYVRNVHRTVLTFARLARLKGRVFNEIVLPTDPRPPQDEYERRLHINPQSAASLRRALTGAGYRVRRVDHWQPPHGPFFDEQYRWDNFLLRILDAVRFLQPFSRFPPLNRWFSNHIWVVAERI